MGRAVNRKQFEHLYNTYADSVARFLSYYTKKPDQLEEWVQITFLKIWKYRDKVDAEGDYLKTYLLKTARNVALTTLRKERNDIIEYRPYLKDIKSGSDQPEYEMNKEKFWLEHDNALKKISPRARQVYKLSREDGLSYKEIAETLSISPKTVEQHISKTLNILRKELGEFKR